MDEANHESHGLGPLFFRTANGFSAVTETTLPLRSVPRTDSSTATPPASFTGFRKIKIDGEIFKINGVPVKLKGINRHEFLPRSGRTVDASSIHNDLILMKRANINMIRTSSSP